MTEIYNIVWLMNKLKLFCAGVDSHIKNVLRILYPQVFLHDTSIEWLDGDEVFWPFLIIKI